MTACADLDLNPLSEGSSENWYHDETEIEMAINDWWRPDFFPIDGIEQQQPVGILYIRLLHVQLKSSKR